MTQKRSWADRRWKIFENVYRTDKTFGRDLKRANEIFANQNELSNVVISILETYEVPHWCVNAAIAYTRNPSLKRDEYLEMIVAPFVYWSMTADVVGPNRKVKASRMFSERFSKRNMKLIENGTEVDISKAATIVSGGHVMLQLSPYTNRTELKELIDEYWDELEPMLQAVDGTINPKVGLELLGKVQSPQLQKLTDRDALIMSLQADGKSDGEIITKLEDSGHGLLSLEYIRQIRYRIRHKNKK